MSSTQTINHGGHTYRTSWPKQMFTSWINTRLDADGNPRRNDDEICPHCQNGGLVILDATGSGVACPMCQIGRMQNVHWRTMLRFDKNGKPAAATILHPQEFCWRPQDDVAQYSWNNGLGIDHTTMCGQCRRSAAIPGHVCRSCHAANTYNPGEEARRVAL